MCAVTEIQGKGGLHSHGIRFQFIHDMALKRFAHNEDNAQEVYDAIDSHISGEVASRDSNKERRMWVDNTTPVPSNIVPLGQRAADEFHEEVKLDADMINSMVNYHGKCRPGTCCLKYKGCTMYRFGVLKRASECTKCSDLVLSARDPGKVDARTTIHSPPIQDER